jgi:gamma-glutamylcyclotransferase (GGCT)/AIG2-like uncharacterized protein YtfP
MALLFAYGTLMPVDAQAAAAAQEGWTPDAVRGRLFDLGAYPALIDLGDPGAGWVEGFVRAVDRHELEGPLDSWEGVAEGVYRRVESLTRNNRAVWVYVYSLPLPPEARGPLDRWDGTRRAPHLLNCEFG